MTTEGTITLNGKPEVISFPMTVAGLLAHLGMDGKPVVVELDEAALSPRDFATTSVHNGSRVEIVVLAAGG